MFWELTRAAGLVVMSWKDGRKSRLWKVGTVMHLFSVGTVSFVTGDVQWTDERRGTGRAAPEGGGFQLSFLCPSHLLKHQVL